jgi:DNA repair protein SbcD/Mre11
LLDKLPHEVLQASPELLALKQDPGACMADRLQQATPIVLARMASTLSS